LSAKPTDGEDSSGIGLFGVKRNAELIEADVYCSSKIGEGAEFVLKIKL
jgi:signal transduction histidine kinase